jgi:hypothetical protein
MFKSLALASMILVVLGLSLRSKSVSVDALTQEKATAVRDGQMTSKQQEHSKLYKEYSLGQKRIPDELASEESGITIKVNTPLVFLERDPDNSQKLLPQLACDADAIVVGIIQDKSSQLTDSKDFVFTDYEMIIGDVLKDNTASPISPQSTITITRPGGIIQINGKTVNAIDTSFLPLETGKRYLFFLHFISSTGAYNAVNALSSFRITDAKINKLTQQSVHFDNDEDDPVSFIRGVRIAVANGCSKREKGDK